jgi:hypothetical protein
MTPLAIILLLIFLYCLAPAPLSVVPTVGTAVAAQTAAGHIEVIPKAKYIELKKISSPNQGKAEYAGILNIGKISVVPVDSGVGGFGISATASSSLGGNTPDKVLDYGNAGSMWHSKVTPNLGEWIRLELSTPMALKKVIIANRPDVPGGTDHESARIMGTQVTIMDANSKPIKTYIVGNNAASLEFSGY